MDAINFIGFLGTLLGIYSFFKNETRLFCLLKKTKMWGYGGKIVPLILKGLN